ncbi:MAG: hypothetical protein ACK45B_00370 [Limisphaerales bacterium]|jgi:plastocyanin
MKTMPRFHPIQFLVSCVLALCLPVHAVIHYVTVDGNGFDPASLTITAGDTVVWINDDEDDFPHTIVSTLPSSHPQWWQGVVVGYSDTLSRTFTVPGTYTYQDTLEGNFGTVIVQAAPPTLSVQLENPRVVGGQFRFEVSGLTVGRLHLVESSTNLVHWTAISTNLATASTVTHTNAADGSGWFFRVVELP